MTLTRRLLLLALISVLPAIAIWTYTEVSLRRARETEVKDLVLRQAHLAGSEVERILDGIQSLLVAVDQVPSVRSFDPDPCASYLNGLQQRVPYLASIVVLDRGGLVRCGARNPDPARYPDRAYLKEALEENRFVIGTYTTDFREGGVEGLPMLPLALPVWDAEGAIVGVVATALDLNWLGAKLKERILPADGSLTVSDHSGTIIAREPLPDRFVGTRIPDAFHRYIHDVQPGVFETVSQDGVKRILGYIPVDLPPRGIYVSAGLSTKAAFDTVNRAAKRGFLLIAAALILALALSWLAGHAFISKPFAAMTDAVRAWRRGNYLARINLPGSPGELGLLANAFNDLMDDVAERQQALQASEERARLALDAGHMGTWWYDHNKKLGGWSSQAAVLLGRPGEQKRIRISEWRALVHPDDLDHALERLRKTVREGGEYEDEYRIRYPGGEVRWINSKGRVFLDSRRRPVYFVGVIQDVTDRKRSEDQQRFFLDELNHRVKNTLATVQSIAAQTLRSTSGAAHFKEAFEGRLLALSKTHDLLTRNAWRDADLSEILTQELAPYRRSHDDRVVAEGPSVNLPARHAINFGLVLHELVTNAAKYGALSTPTGRLTVRWSTGLSPEGGTQLNLHWQESEGPPVEAPQHQGFGSRLIRRSVEGELAGRVEICFQPEGVSYRIHVPLS